MARKIYVPVESQCRADSSIEQILKSLRQVKRSIANLETDEKFLSDLVRNYMGEATTLFDHTGKRLLATWEHSERDSVDLELLKKRFPRTYDKVRKAVPIRTLLLKGETDA